MTENKGALDERMMLRALELAEKGAGWVSPNPMVGAVVCRGEEIVAEGYHERFGQAHAERVALDLAGDQAQGATLYATLEPCRHAGKTPPCLDRVLESGVARVAIAMEDPNPLVAGRSIERLREKGVAVEVGVRREECRRLNLPYISFVTRKRPWVTLKYAMTLDGRIATRSGESRWISHEASRRIVHDLRRRNRGILVGYNTVIRDDPRLTCRADSSPPPRQPVRIVLGGREALSGESQLVRTVSEVPILRVVSSFNEPIGESEGVECVGIGASSDGDLSLEELMKVLYDREIDGLLVEGGGRTLSSFLSAGLADEVYVFIAPKLLNDAEALAPFPGAAASPSMKEALALGSVEVREIDGDALIHGYLSEL